MKGKYSIAGAGAAEPFALSRSATSSTARWPISWSGWRIVVSGGQTSAETGVSSKLAIDRSAGTLSPT